MSYVRCAEYKAGGCGPLPLVVSLDSASEKPDGAGVVMPANEITGGEFPFVVIDT